MSTDISPPNLNDNDDISLLDYGKKLLNCEGMNKNNKEASKYLRIAADKGNSEAMLLYGCMHYKGEDIPVNKTEGIKYIQSSAEKNVDAIYNKF